MLNYLDLNLDSLFLYCAWGGSAIYIIRILIGFGSGLDTDSMDTATDHFSDDAFHFLSLNALVGFLMMFGWGGLASSRQFHFSTPATLFIAIASGSFFIFMISLIFKNAKKLISTGTVFDIQKTVGKEGRVYQRIEGNKRGVIHVVLDDFTRKLEAISLDNREIPSFQPVQIVRVVDDKTVIVKRIK